MSEDCITIHTNKKNNLPKKKLNELEKILLEKVISGEPLDGDCEYDHRKKTLTACGDFNPSIIDQADSLLKKIKRITNTDPFLEVYYESVGETQWYALLGDKAQTYDSYDELISSIENYNKSCNVYPDTKLEEEFETDRSINILLRYQYKAKKRLNAAVEKFQTAIKDPTTENLQTLCCDEFIKTYFRDCEKILKHIKFVNIDKQFLYVGIRLDDIRDKGFDFSEEDLFILLYPWENDSDRMMLRSRYDDRELHYFLTEDEPFYNSRKRRGKDEWEPINKWKYDID